MIKKNLIVTLDEANVGGEQDVLSFRTISSSNTNIVIEASVPKLSVNAEHISLAIKELLTFNSTREPTPQQEPINISPTIEYGESHQ